MVLQEIEVTSGHLLLPMEKILMVVEGVHAMMILLVLVYHLLEITSSVTVEQRPMLETGYILRILSGMDKDVALTVNAVPSTTHHGSVLSLISLHLKTLSYECVLTRTPVMKMCQLNTLNYTYSN